MSCCKKVGAGRFEISGAGRRSSGFIVGTDNLLILSLSSALFELSCSRCLARSASTCPIVTMSPSLTLISSGLDTVTLILRFRLLPGSSPSSGSDDDGVLCAWALGSDGSGTLLHPLMMIRITARTSCFTRGVG